jgi:hypothetical protein
MYRMLHSALPTLSSDAPILSLVAAYAGIAGLLAVVVGFPMPPISDYLLSVRAYVGMALGLWSLVFLVQLFRRRPPSPIAYCVEFAREWRLLDRVRLGLPVLLAVAAFAPVFGSVKRAIPKFVPYQFDPLFVRADEVLHGGDAWQLIQPLVGYPFVSFVLNGAYHAWMFLLFGLIFVAGWLERPQLRLQFLTAYLLCWMLLGSVFATLFSSVGPCFYEFFYGDQRFAPLMAYLNEADASFPIPALDIQQMLLEWARTDEHGLGRGISAMPSLHVAVATLYALLGWRISRRWGIVASAFLIVILLGSVHLGYHYAIDGYFSIVATIILWQMSGAVAQRWASPLTNCAGLEALPSVRAAAAARD